MATVCVCGPLKMSMLPVRHARCSSSLLFASTTQFGARSAYLCFERRISSKVELLNDISAQELVSRATAAQASGLFHKRKDLKSTTQQQGLRFPQKRSGYTIGRQKEDHELLQEFSRFRSALRSKANNNDGTRVSSVRECWSAFLRSRASEGLDFDAMLRICDLRRPGDAYPAARRIYRNVILHLGLTNSGKTYAALKELEQARRGIYLSPLRLLAIEAWKKLNDAGFPCNLVTGEERRIVDPNARLVSSTIEMANLAVQYDVAVIDEIQMLADEYRGSAWTQAFLGLRAQKLHLCGSPAASDLIKKICHSFGETVTVKEYTRLASLKVAKHSLNGDFKKTKGGDCIVAFSRQDVHDISKRVYEETGLKPALVYGALPPEVRVEQASVFNAKALTGSNVLVATDAIGMGLNLAISRIIFYTTEKTEQGKQAPLSVAQIRQIAGRAGRYGVDRASGTGGGTVTCMEEKDMAYLCTSIAGAEPQLEAAGLYPTLDQIMKLSSCLPVQNLASVMSAFEALAQLDRTSYFLCQGSQVRELAALIEDIPLPMAAKFAISMAPVRLSYEYSFKMVRCIAEHMAKAAPLHLADAVAQVADPALLLDSAAPPKNTGKMSQQKESINLLHSLESLHNSLGAYFWLRQKFPGHPTLSATSDADIEKFREISTERVSSLLAKVLQHK